MRCSARLRQDAAIHCVAQLVQDPWRVWTGAVAACSEQARTHTQVRFNAIGKVVDLTEFELFGQIPPEGIAFADFLDFGWCDPGVQLRSDLATAVLQEFEQRLVARFLIRDRVIDSVSRDNPVTGKNLVRQMLAAHCGYG